MRRITFLFLSALLMLSALPLRADVNYLKEPLTIETTTTSSGGKIEFRRCNEESNRNNTTINLEYRIQTNGGEWGEWIVVTKSGDPNSQLKPQNANKYINLSASTTYKIQLRGNNLSGFSKSTSDYYRILIGSSSTSWNVTISGNVMSLIVGYNTDNESNAKQTLANADEIPCSHCFYGLFNNFPDMNSSTQPTAQMAPPKINAANLMFPAKYLKDFCYAKMLQTASQAGSTIVTSYKGGFNEGPNFLATEFKDKSGKSVSGACAWMLQYNNDLKYIHVNFTTCPGDNCKYWNTMANAGTAILYAPAVFRGCSTANDTGIGTWATSEWSYTPPAETYTITWKDYDGTVIRTDENITSGTATSAPANPTRTATDEYTYSFTGWTPAPAATVTADATYTATYSTTPRSYTLTWQTDGNTLTGNYTTGSTAYGTTIVRPDTPTKNADQQYTYTFNAWSPSPAATMPAAITTYTATWNRTTNRYTVSFAPMTNGTISVKDAEENTINSGDKVDYGTILTITATPASGYEFDSWLTGTSTNVIVTDNITLGATFKAETTPEIILYDNAAPKADNVETTNALLLSAYAGRTVNVTLYHNFTANLWNTLCLPFNLSTDDCPELEGNVYELSDCTTGTDGMTITFQPVTWKPDYSTEMIAGKPYLVWTERPLSSLRFAAVTLSTFTPAKTTAPSGDVDFQSVFEQGYLTEKSQIFIGSNNRLYYANPAANGGNGTRIRGYRAYFEILDTEFLDYYTQPRVRIVVNDDKNTVLTFDEEQTEMETRKYIENGVLVIERGGVKYNAQGKRL